MVLAEIRLLNYSMAVSYFNAHSLSSNAQKAYDPAVSNSGSVLHDCPQRNGAVFGLEVQQAAPSNYLNSSNPYGESFHNPFSDYRFPKVPVRVLYHQEPGQSEPLGLSNKTKAQQSDENILYTGQSGFRIDRVWSMAVEANSQPHSINANPSLLDATLKDTAGNGSSGMGQSTPQISSVVDNTSQKQSGKRKASCKVYEQSEKRKASYKAYEESEKRKASRNAYRQSDKGQASSKAYRQSDKGRASSKASNKAYRQSDKGKATRKAYQKAYRQSDKSKAYQKAYHKAYREVFNKTGDREQAKIAGKQATAFIQKSNKFWNSEIESIAISSLTPHLSG